MTMFRTIALGAAALTLAMAALPAAAQSYRGGRDADRYDRRDDDRDAVAGVVVGAIVGGLAGAVIGDGDERYVAGGVLAGAALGAAAADDDDDDYRRYGASGYSYGYGRAYGSSYGGYNGDCDYWRDGRCWRNRGHWERENGINSRDGYDRYERGVLRGDRRDWRSDRRDRRDGRREDRRDDRRWRNY